MTPGQAVAQAAPRKKTIHQIESLRIMAMGSIFLYHIWSVLPGFNDANPLGAWFGDLLSQGYLGVVVFNAMTGFLLAMPHVGAGARPVPGMREYFSRRFLRICPQYFISLVIFSIAALAAGTYSPGALAGKFVEHALFLHTFDAATFFSIVPAYWWMGLLAQFYLIFPLVIGLYGKLGAGRGFTAIGVVCWGGWYFLGQAAAASPGSAAALVDYMLFYNIPARLPEFALGMFLATLWKEKSAGLSAPGTLALSVSLAGLAAGLAGFLAAGLIPAPLVFKHIFLIAGCIGSALFLFLTPVMSRLGAAPAVAMGGAASYSFYLLHQPLVGYGADLLRGSMPPFQAFVVVAVLAGIVAYIGARWLDALAARLLAALDG
ncbi:MAG: acyltransferase [Desulfovibrionaceae bacterium]|nr:acyltransferase [Desulfovibrionaceae bacterium]MBF0515021.1 acyltransferase [Desulfovibrionaceae bacterium]